MLKNSGYLPLTLIILIVLVSYFNSTRNGFVYDDWDLVAGKRYEEVKPLLYPFIGALREGAYRPLRDISHAIDRLIWGMDPMGHHITNILIHIGSSVIVFYIAVSIFGEVLPEERLSERQGWGRQAWAAFLTSIFFGVHPVQTESVTWISGRRDILCGFFFLLGLLVFIKFKCRSRGGEDIGAGKKYYIGGIIFCYLLSLSSKAMGVTLPLILILFDFIFGDHDRRRLRFRMKHLYIPLLILAICFSILTMHVGSGQRRKTFHGESRYFTTLAMGKVTVRYIKLLIFPVDLCLEYVDSVPRTIKEPTVLVSLLTVAVILVTGILTLRRDRVVSLGILWFFITLLPVSNILVPVGNMMAERYLYIPSIGFCILLGGLISRVRLRYMGEAWKSGVFIALPIIVSYSCLTAVRNEDWKDNIALWDKTMVQCPASTRAIYNLGNAYSRADMFDDAIVYFKKVMAIDPYSVKYHNCVGHVYAEQGLFEEAKREFKIALALDPLSGLAHFNLGTTYQREGNSKGAIYELKKAVVLNPEETTFHFNLGCAYEADGRLRKAAYHYGEALVLDSYNIRALNNLGVIYRRMGRFDEAKLTWQKVLEIDPDFRIAVDNLKGLEDFLQQE